MATGISVPPPPLVWAEARGQALFRPPVTVEIQKPDLTFVVSPPALLALSKPSAPGLQDDRTHVTGVIRVTYGGSSPMVLVGRARGDLGTLKINGVNPPVSWLGLDAGHDPQWPLNPRGWHPFSVRVPGGPVLIIEMRNLRLSLLLARTI